MEPDHRTPLLERDSERAGGGVIRARVISPLVPQVSVRSGRVVVLPQLGSGRVGGGDRQRGVKYSWLVDALLGIAETERLALKHEPNLAQSHRSASAEHGGAQMRKGCRSESFVQLGVKHHTAFLHDGRWRDICSWSGALAVESRLIIVIVLDAPGTGFETAVVEKRKPNYTGE